MQQQRFELKYLVQERIALAARDYVSSYLELDDYSARQPDLSYTIHSLYLDSDDLETHYATVNGNRNRFKLRVRYYDGSPESPVFLEIKGRNDNCILKQRCGVRRDALTHILAGQTPAPASVLARQPHDWSALENFNQLRAQLRATPRAHNVYQREAWVSAQNDWVRVNFDRNVRLEPCFEPRPVVEMMNPTRLYSEFVVLELKFAGRFPNWFRLLVETFNLMQTSAGKFSDGVTVVGESRFRGRGSAVEPALSATQALAFAGSVAPGMVAPAQEQTGYE